MGNLKKTHELVRQNDQIVNKSQKHDINSRKSSTLYFQIGLIVCLLAAYGLLEMKFETQISNICALPIDGDRLAEISIENFKVYEEPKVEIKNIERKVLLTKDPTIVDNDYVLKEVLDIHTSEQNVSSDKLINIGSMNVLDKPKDEGIVDFIKVEQVPIYPGCENKKSNDEKRKCMSDKITQLVQRKFNGSDIASNYGLTGKQKIDVQFTIDKTGHVTDIKARAPHTKLEDEAVRIINFIPEMTPGKQRDKNVGVIYNLPIVFQVE